MTIFNKKYKRVRFHIEFGPQSLFERVKFKMKNVSRLYMDGAHLRTRIKERNISEDILKQLKEFNINEWKLVTASVDRDSGKFVDSTWEILIDNTCYWITIGMGTYVKTIVIKETSGIDKCVQSGKYYDFVDEVNKKLMEKESLI